MIEGSVNADHEAIVSLLLRGPAGRTIEVEAVVDTGFNRFVALPVEIITALGTPPVGSNRVMLGDGSEAYLDVYGVTVLWEGAPKRVDAYAADTTPLLGMRLLDGHSLYVEVEVGGRVVIEPGATGHKHLEATEDP